MTHAESGVHGVLECLMGCLRRGTEVLRVLLRAFEVASSASRIGERGAQIDTVGAQCDVWSGRWSMTYSSG